MSLARARRAAFAALALSFIAVACKDDVLGPPDAASCTVGTLQVGHATHGRVDTRSCPMWNDYQAAISPAESWTLPVEANTAYIVRLQPLNGADDANTFSGELHAFARSSGADASFAGGYYNSYGPTNTRGGRARQMILTPSAAGRVSVRVQTFTAADTGSYELEVIACPVVRVATGATSAATTLDDDCTLRFGAASDSQRVAFFSFAAETNDEVDVTATRTAGLANMRLYVGGPDLDFSCYTGDCTFTSSTSSGGPHLLRPDFPRGGRFSAMIAQEGAGELSATLKVAPTAMLRASTIPTVH